jgi:hypothetical protein
MRGDSTGGTVSAAQPGGWRTLRLSIIAGVLRASVDGIEVLTAFDDAPLPPGTLTLESIGGNTLTVDDVSVWLAGDGATAPLATPTPESIPFPSTGFGVTSARSARSAGMQTAGSFVFRQNFDTFSELRTRVTGQPAATIGSAVDLSAGSGFSAFAQKSATSSQPVSLQIDFQIGRDPLTVYRVTGYTWVGSTQFIGAQHTFTVQLKDRDDAVLFERSCTWTASAANPNLCDLQPPAGIDQVRTVTVLISLPATTATGKLNIDDFELYADLETTIQPTAILTNDILYARSAAVNDNAFLEYADASGYAPETLFGSFPVWSMDGTQLSYLDSDLFACVADATISPINVQTCTDSPLLLPALPDSQWSPVWSPDGTRVAYLQVTQGGSRLDLFVRNSDDPSGATTFNLTEYETTTLHLMPAWAPAAQGNKIAFAAGTDRDYLSLYVVDLDNGNHITQITTGGNHILPLWSETGTALAFVNPGAGWTDPQFFDIPLNLSAPPVTQPAATFAPPATSRWGQVWTPTGSLLAALTRYDLGNFDIVDGSGALIDRGLGVMLRLPFARQPINPNVIVDFDPAKFDRVNVIINNAEQQIEILETERQALQSVNLGQLNLAGSDPDAILNVSNLVQQQLRDFQIAGLDACATIPTDFQNIPSYNISNRKLRDFCEVHVSLLMLVKVLDSLQPQRDLTYSILLESLISGEYGAYIPLFNEIISNGERWVWPDEAIARQFYEACGVDGCQDFEIYNAFDYFQAFRNGTLTSNYFAFQRVKRKAEEEIQ